MAIRQDIGIVTAYGYAVSKGYEGTEEEFAQAMADVGLNVSEIEASIKEFNEETVPAAMQSIIDEGNARVANVTAEGTRQMNAVAQRGANEILAVENAGTTQIRLVNEAGASQVEAVNSAGTTQVGNVNTAGGTQVAAVQAKGQEVIDSIPSDYSALTQEVSDLNQALNDRNYSDVERVLIVQKNGKMIAAPTIEQGRYASGGVAKQESTTVIRSKFILFNPSQPLETFVASGINYWLTLADSDGKFVAQTGTRSTATVYDFSQYANARYAAFNIVKQDGTAISPSDIPENSFRFYQFVVEENVPILVKQNIGNIESIVSMYNHNGGQSLTVDFEQGRFYSGTGKPSNEYAPQPNWVRSINPILVNSALKYIVNRTHSLNVNIYQYDKNYNYVREDTIYSSGFGVERTLDSRTCYVNLAIYNDGITPETIGGNTIFSQPSIINDDNFIPDYFQTQIDTKLPSIIENMNNAGNTGKTFLFITDPHWESNYRISPSLMRYILQRTNITNVVCGGDIINEGEKESMYAVFINFVKSFQFPLCHMFLPIARGNHDDNSNWSTEEEIAEHEFPFGTVYNLMMNQVSDEVNMLASNEFSFWYDEKGTKTRFIILDTQRNGQYIPHNAVIALLKTVPQDWHVIFIMHMLMRNSTGLFQGADVLAHIVKAYNDRTSGSYIGVNYDFTTGAIGHVEFIMGGHMHADMSMAYDDPNNPAGVPIICTDTDSYRDHSGTGGTVNSQCFDIVTCDYTNKTVKCVRIGRGNDRTFSY